MGCRHLSGTDTPTRQSGIIEGPHHHPGTDTPEGEWVADNCLSGTVQILQQGREVRRI